jgi:hypothetical protein
LAPLPGRRARRLGPHSERLKERRLPVTSRPAVDSYLSQVAATATQAYAAAGANVLVSTDTNLLHPYMTHTIKSTIPIPSDCVDPGQVENLVYGCTNNAAKFPLTDPDLDLAPTPASGLNLNSIFRGIARGPIGGDLFGWVDNLPKQPRNSDPSSWSAGNPSPDVIFLNRLVNVTVHEMAHGFGLVSGKPYLLHGAPPLTATMHAVDGEARPVQTIGGLTWVETDSTGDLRHEPILSERPGATRSGLPLRGGRIERMKGSRPARMPVYRAGFRRKPRA